MCMWVGGHVWMCVSEQVWASICVCTRASNATFWCLDKFNSLCYNFLFHFKMKSQRKTKCSD